MRAKYQGNHIDHSGVSSDEEQECNLYSIGFGNGSRLDLLRAQLADEVVLGLLQSLVSQTGKVVK